MEMSEGGKYLNHAIFLTVEEVLSHRIQVTGFSNERINKVKFFYPLLSTTNHKRFKDHLGVSDVVVV